MSMVSGKMSCLACAWVSYFVQFGFLAPLQDDEGNVFKTYLTATDFHFLYICLGGKVESYFIRSGHL